MYQGLSNVMRKLSLEMRDSPWRPMRRGRVEVLLAQLLLLAVGGISGVVAQQVAPSPSPTNLEQMPIPPVAPDFRAERKALPSLSRVGVDMNRQHPLSLRDALALALELTELTTRVSPRQPFMSGP